MSNATRSEVIDASLALLVCASVCIVLWFFLVMFQVQAWWNDFKDRFDVCHSRNSADVKASTLQPLPAGVKSMRVYLFVNALVTLATACLVLAMALPNWSAISCVVMGKLAPSLYALATQMAYLFFMKKAELVGRFERGAAYKLVRRVCWLCLCIFMPIIILPLILWDFSGRVIYPEQYCVLYLEFIYLPVIFEIGNVAFSCALLFLFVYPLYKNAQHVRAGNKHASKRIIGVATHNVKLALIALFSTFVAITFMMVSFVMSEQDHYRYDYLLIVDVTLIFMDMPVNSLMAHLMTNSWMPRYLKRITQMISTDTDDLESTGGGGEGGKATGKFASIRKSFKSMGAILKQQQIDTSVISTANSSPVREGNNNNNDTVAETRTVKQTSLLELMNKE